MSFTENPRSALCSAGVCCGRYAGRSPNHPPSPSPNGAQKHKPERRCAAPALVFRFFDGFVLSP